MLTLIAIRMLRNNSININRIKSISMITRTNTIQDQMIITRSNKDLTLLRTVRRRQSRIRSNQVLGLRQAATNRIRMTRHTRTSTRQLLTNTYRPLTRRLNLTMKISQRRQSSILERRVSQQRAVNNNKEKRSRLLNILKLNRTNRRIRRTISILLMMPRQLLRKFTSLLTDNGISRKISTFNVRSFNRALANTQNNSVRTMRTKTFSTDKLTMTRVISSGSLFTNLVRYIGSVDTSMTTTTNSRGYRD